jgi:hypothetical protein
MSGVVGYYYSDYRGRKILHVPGVFVVIEPAIDETEVILNPKRLESRLRGLQMVMANYIRAVERVEVPEDKVKRIIRLCFSHRKSRAREYCERLFDNVRNQLADGYEDNPIQDLGYDTDGYDPRFRGSLF